MSFETPLNVMFLDDRNVFPWITLSPLVYESPLTGETYEVPKHFRTDGASIPAAIIAIPTIGQALALRFMGHGVWQGFKQGVLHDYLRRSQIVTPKVAHLVFKESLIEAGYSDDLVSAYYTAVKLFNS